MIHETSNRHIGGPARCRSVARLCTALPGSDVSACPQSQGRITMKRVTLVLLVLLAGCGTEKAASPEPTPSPTYQIPGWINPTNADAYCHHEYDNWPVPGAESSIYTAQDMYNQCMYAYGRP